MKYIFFHCPTATWYQMTNRPAPVPGQGVGDPYGRCIVENYYFLFNPSENYYLLNARNCLRFLYVTGTDQLMTLND